MYGTPLVTKIRDTQRHVQTTQRHVQATQRHVQRFLNVTSKDFSFVDDLKTLYVDGVTAEIGGKVCTFYGGLLAFLADNLAAHAVGGFQCSAQCTKVETCNSKSYS